MIDGVTFVDCVILLKEQSEPGETFFDEQLALQVEFINWRRRQGLQPSPDEALKFKRLALIAACASGLLFAPWAERL